ncbi:HVO_A0114 family putative DNA-binding protein [Rubrimonas sp.]|uniref:HVO_A0114 family putative DNA-binding protein n=1 Tax=Rubrimonas sp. TaxID=2036015 RepID=UPI002FDDEC29
METGANTLILSVAGRDEIERRAVAAFAGEPQGARVSFASVDLLWKVLTPKRWALMKALAGQGPMTIRAAARRVDRDVKAVHGDIHALLDAGLLDRTDDGLIVFGYDALRVEFTLQAA